MSDTAPTTITVRHLADCNADILADQINTHIATAAEHGWRVISTTFYPAVISIDATILGGAHTQPTTHNCWLVLEQIA